jgi:hypothetical protein
MVNLIDEFLFGGDKNFVIYIAHTKRHDLVCIGGLRESPRQYCQEVRVAVMRDQWPIERRNHLALLFMSIITYRTE